MESAFFYNTFFALAPSHELPDDVLDIISSFSKPLNRRVVSCRWDETETENDMLDRVDQWLTEKAYYVLDEGEISNDHEDHLTHFNVDRKFDGTKWSFTVIMINIDGEMEDHVINTRDVFNLTFTRDELYRWGGINHYITNNGYRWGYWLKLLPDHDLVTHLQDNKGEVIRRI
jgi:hypothetical protein